MYAVMWSEHCSYKSSRIHLKRLPTEGESVLVGPGENAGVLDVGDGIAVAIRIESHNHPSAIEPYQGAATGAGGILRDIFTMGARPIALMDPLRFGPLDDPRSRWIAEGVVAGISGYGNSVGVPTVGGEVVFDETYKGNPLVNVLCLGVMPKDRLVLGQASRRGQPRRAARQLHRPGRHRRRQRARLRGLQRGDRGRQAPVRAGRGSLRGEAAHRGVPDAARRRPGRRHPGLRRRGPHLRHERDRLAGRDGHGRERRRRPPSGAGHGALRGDDQRVPGADAGHRRARRPRGGAVHLRPLGGGGRRRGQGHLDRPAPHPRRLGRRGAGRRAGLVPPRRRPALRAPDGDRAPGGRRRGRCRRGARRLRRRPARPAHRHLVGLPPVRPPAVPQHGGRPRRRRHRAPAEAPDHRPGHRPGAGARRPTATTAGARSTPRRARPWSWPRPC